MQMNCVEMNFLLNPWPLSFGLGPQSFYFRGPACSWQKNVSLYPCAPHGPVLEISNCPLAPHRLNLLGAS